MIYRYSNKILLVKKLLDDKQCDNYIQMAEAIGFEEATITTSQGYVMNKNVRNNDRVIFDDPEFAQGLFKIIKPYVEDPYKHLSCVGLNERFRFYRYYPGQKFDWHYDGSYKRENGERSRWTLLFYLNNDYRGGRTQFLDDDIAGEKGDALLFVHRQVHCGETVQSGVKYILRTDVMYESPGNKSNH
ncbi:MAG: proline hydroxylase [Sphaerospermopsis sp. SIO1G2]|nr:proline hydroxylase [Sphaerospermopsis sp. SIO1G1]NET74410.1 proline hydroxylase [Sphaerospermopsis sp. SIO1G2]